jgi:hypothetical protein
MSGRYALIVANTEYTDPGLAPLTAPGKDAEDFARVLRSPDIAAFEKVFTLINRDVFIVNQAIEDFFSGKKPSDLLLLYFSGHGVRDENGYLYLAVKNTNRGRLRSTAIKSDFIREAMDHSRSKRQVLILDCCNSGAYAQGTKAAPGGSIGTASAFEGTGYGRIVLTASDSTQFAWEGDKIIGETANSLFTHFLVKGLEGDADQDGDGKITVDELYDYAYEQIISRTPNQTPGKWSYKQQGEIVLRQSARSEVIKSARLPADLLAATENTLPYVREGAVRQLEELLKGKNVGMARSARALLEKIALEDDSRYVVSIAKKVLDSVSQTEDIQIRSEEISTESFAKVDAARPVEMKMEDDRLMQRRANAIRMAQQGENYAQRSRPMAMLVNKRISEQETRRISTVWTLVLLGTIVLLSYAAIKILRNSTFFSPPPTDIPVTGLLVRPTASPEASKNISIEPFTASPTETSIPSPSSTPTLSVPTSTPTLIIPSDPADILCNAAPKRLSVGVNAEVVTITLPLKLRENPSRVASIMEQMPRGTIVSVIGGPLCNAYASGYFWWWNVRAPSGKVGWIVEGYDSGNPVYVQPVN